MRSLYAAACVGLSLLSPAPPAVFANPGGPPLPAPPCPPPPCETVPTPRPRVVVELSPPEVVFQQAPPVHAQLPPVKHHGLFGKHTTSVVVPQAVAPSAVAMPQAVPMLLAPPAPQMVAVQAVAPVAAPSYVAPSMVQPAGLAPMPACATGAAQPMMVAVMPAGFGCGGGAAGAGGPGSAGLPLASEAELREAMVMLGRVRDRLSAQLVTETARGSASRGAAAAATPTEVQDLQQKVNAMNTRFDELDRRLKVILDRLEKGSP